MKDASDSQPGSLKWSLAISGIVSVQAIFAGYHMLGHAVFSNGLNPIAFALVREVGASTVFVAAAYALTPAAGWPKRCDMPQFFLCGACLFGSVFGALFALSLTSGATVAMLQPTQPIFATMLVSYLGHEIMTKRKVLGVLVCVTGGILTCTSRNIGNGNIHAGVAVIIVQCLCGAAYIVFQQPLLKKGYSPLIVSGGSYVAATGFGLIVASSFFTYAHHMELQVIWWDSSSLFKVAVCYAILAATVYNFIVIAWVTGELGATIVTLFTILQGMFAVTAEYFLYSTPITMTQICGFVVIFIGMVLAMNSSSDHSASKNREDKMTATSHYGTIFDAGLK